MRVLRSVNWHPRPYPWVFMKCSSNLSSSIFCLWDECCKSELTKLASAFSNSLNDFLAYSMSNFLRAYGASEWKAAISKLVSGFESLTLGIFVGILSGLNASKSVASSEAAAAVLAEIMAS